MAFARPGTDVALAALTARARRIYILGTPPATAVILGQVQGLDATIYDESTHPVVTVQRADGPCRVSWAGIWFGDDGGYDDADCIAVWRHLRGCVRSAWKDATAELLATPATTGRDLWQRTIPPAGWPVMSDRAQHAIRSVSGQGRIEVMDMPHAGALVPALHEYDARLAYVSCMRELPIGHPRYLAASQLGQLDLHKPGKYLVTFTVPAGWRHPGILPVPVGSDGWTWPHRGDRQTHGPTWVDAVELWCARKWGWDVTVHAGVVWDHTGDPLRTWQTRLVKLLDQAPETEPRRSMYRHAVRAMILFALGAMHGSGRKVTRVGDDPPADAEHIRVLADGRMRWTEREPPKWPEMAHPEWTGTVWARARIRLLDAPGNVGALHLPPGQVVALRTDAIYTTAQTGWTDDGRIGRYRLKGSYRGGPWPRTGNDVLAMKREGS